MLIIKRLNCIDVASGIVTFVSGYPVPRLGENWSSLSTCAPDSHLLRVTIPNAASIQLNS